MPSLEPINGDAKLGSDQWINGSMSMSIQYVDALQLLVFNVDAFRSLYVDACNCVDAFNVPASMLSPIDALQKLINVMLSPITSMLADRST